MAQQAAEIDALLGMARNPVHGQATAPTEVFNLVPNRAGGLSPFGRRLRLQDGAVDVTVPPAANLIGSDETGISSFLDATGKLTLFRGRTQHVQRKAAYGIERSEMVHLDAAGSYRNRDAYLLYDRDNRPVEPIAVQMSATATAGSPTEEAADITVDDVTHVAIGGGRMVVAYGSKVAAGPQGGTLANEHDFGAFVNLVKNVEYGNGRFFVVTYDNKAHYSDTGVTWTTVDINAATGRAADSDIMQVKWAGGSRWVAVGRRISYSADNGVGWTEVDDLAGPSNSWLLVDVAYNPDDGVLLAPTTHRYPGTENPTHMFGTELGSDPGLKWNTLRELAAPPLVGPVGVHTYGVPAIGSGEPPFEGFRSTWNDIAYGKGRYVVALQDGRIWGSDGSAPSQGGDADSAFWSKYTFSSWASLGTNVMVFEVAFNPVSELFVAVGHTTGEVLEPRVWNSADGRTWTRVNLIEDAMMAEGQVLVTDVAFDEDGQAYYTTSDAQGHGKVYASGVTALSEGSYNIYLVAYLNTPAGRLVFGFLRETVTVLGEFGGRINVNVPDAAKLRADNPWIVATEAAMATDIVADLRYDIYIQLIADPIEGVVPENTIRYAYTAPFDGEDAPSAITELPLGRQMVTRGAPTTSVLEKALTALHQGRMWGMAHQDEAQWHEGDGISLEIANQANRFVLCYSEVGWANLMSDQSFIPIQPTQSTRFTGLLSTPMGLLVMFDNEIHIVTGDPAFDNVTVELFSDFVGCDDGAKPCKVGGAPFVVWAGKIWGLSGGAQEVSAGMWLASDPFVAICPEPQNRSLLALSQQGRLYRYILDQQFWLEDASSIFLDTAAMLPNCVCATNDNTRYLTAAGEVYVTKPRDGSPDVPTIRWSGLDFGVPDRRKALYVVKATFEGADVMGRVYDRDHEFFDPFEVPLLNFYSDHENLMWRGVLPILRRNTSPRRIGTLAWRTPVGQAKGDTFDVELALQGVGYDDAIKLPIKFYFSAGGELR